METLYTERLILRKFYLSDIDDFYEYCRNPNVGPNAGWEPHKNREESMTILNEFIRKGEVWAIVEKDMNKVIGSIGLHKDMKRNNGKARMLGYVISQDYWGRGLATEAAKRVIEYGFKEFGIDIISIYHYPFNERSKRVIEKCGFIYEGTLRMASTLFNGDVYDDICYSLTKEEYYKLINK